MQEMPTSALLRLRAVTPFCLSRSGLEMHAERMLLPRGVSTIPRIMAAGATPSTLSTATSSAGTRTRQRPQLMLTHTHKHKYERTKGDGVYPGSAGGRTPAGGPCVCAD